MLCALAIAQRALHRLHRARMSTGAPAPTHATRVASSATAAVAPRAVTRPAAAPIAGPVGAFVVYHFGGLPAVRKRQLRLRVHGARSRRAGSHVRAPGCGWLRWRSVRCRAAALRSRRQRLRRRSLAASRAPWTVHARRGVPGAHSPVRVRLSCHARVISGSVRPRVADDVQRRPAGQLRPAVALRRLRRSVRTDDARVRARRRSPRRVTTKLEERAGAGARHVASNVCRIASPT